MFHSRTLAFYIGRQFLTWFAVMFFTILAVIVLIDAVELLRRGANRPDATIGIITGMTLLRAPFLGQEALPFAVLFGGIFTFLRLSRNPEPVFARASDCSVWPLLLPAPIAATWLGEGKITKVNQRVRGRD